MDFKDFFALLCIWQGDRKNLIETTASQKFRRDVLYVIGRRNDIDGAVLFVHPCQEVSEKSGGHTASAIVVSNTGKRFFNLVNP